MDIDDELNGIEALRQFRSEAAPAAQEPDERIQRHFIETYGPYWCVATIVRFALPGTTLHVAILGMNGGASMHVAAEAADGTLTDAPFLGTTKAEMHSDADQRCLADILSAFGQITTFLVSSRKLSDKKKCRWCGELAHAAQHLRGV